jgi:NodT family efflux transporter outer membrane factor (OMF) lipoprotein
MAAAMCALLTGCALIPHLGPRQKILTPPPSASRITWPRGDWWRQFGDRRLDTLVERATAGNPGLRLARARARRAVALAGIAHANLLPRVNGSASFQRIRFSGQSLEPPPYADHWFWNNTAAVTMSWDLDLWGREHQNYAAALGSAHASAIDAREARLALETAVVRNYIGLSRALALRHIAKRNLKREGRLLSIARQRLRAGIGTQLAVSQSATSVPDTHAQIKALNASIAVLRHQLAALVGDPSPDAFAGLRPRIVLAAAVSLPAKVPANLLGHRPDVVAARLRVEAAGHGIKAARAAFYPDINLAAFVGFLALGFTHFLTASAAQYSATPAISLPLFEGGRLRGKYRGAAAAYDMAVDRYNATVLRAMTGTADDISELKSLAGQAKRLHEALADARVAFREARRGFRQGLTNQIHALEAQRTLLTEEQKLAEVKARRLTQYALLMQALGGGFAANANGASNQLPATEGDTP